MCLSLPGILVFTCLIMETFAIHYKKSFIARFFYTQCTYMPSLKLYDSPLLQAGTTPLMCAAQNGHEDVVSILLEHKAKVDIKRKVNRVFIRTFWVPKHSTGHMCSYCVYYTIHMNSSLHVQSVTHMYVHSICCQHIHVLCEKVY